MRDPHEERLYSCHECDAKFLHERSLKKHRKLHDPNNHNVCGVCSQPFECAADLEKHLQSHLDTNQSRNVSKERNKKKWLKKRKWIAPEKKGFSCSECNSSFMLRNTLVKHLRLHSEQL